MEAVQSSRVIAPRVALSVQFLPVSLFGSVMSLAGLALAWRLAGKAYGADIIVSNAIGLTALAVFIGLAGSYLCKLLMYPDAVRKEFAHPVAGSFFGTIGISILLLSSVLSSYSDFAQLLVWSVGTVVVLALSVIMFSRLLNGSSDPKSAVPAWLIAGVGSLDIVVTGGALTADWTREVNLLAAGIGSVSALVFFVLIFSRLVHHEPMAAGMRPSKMILMAPFSVGFLAYVQLVHKVDMFAALLFYFGLFLFSIISYRLFTRPAPFSPSWWGIGFPMAALSNAALVYSGAVGGAGLGLIAILLLALLTMVIAILAARTLHALAKGHLLSA